MKPVVTSKRIALLGNCLTAEIQPYINSITSNDVLNAPGNGGYGFIDLAVELIKRDMNLLIITLDPHLTEEKIIRTNGRVTYVILRQRKKHVLRDFFHVEVHSIVELLKKEKPDLVHAHWTGPYSLAALLSGFPTVFTLHDNPWEIVRYGGIGFLPLHMIARYVYKKGKYFTAPAPNVVEYARTHGARSIEFIPNPLMSRNLMDLPEQERNPEVITSVLNWNNLKNPKCALKAFNLFLKYHPNATLHLFGERLGKGEDGERWAEKYSLQRNVIFHGKTSNDIVRDYLKHSAILLHTSKTEACNMAVVQAMVLGTVVIGGKNAGGTPFFLDNGQCGVLCDINDPADICRSLRRLTEDRCLLKIMSDSSRSRALSMFSPESVIPQYVRLYNHVLDDNYYSVHQ